MSRAMMFDETNPMTDAAPPLVALRTDPPRFSIDEAAALARALFGIEGETRALYGERDQNFHIRPASGDGIVLKIVSAAEGAAAIDYQTETLTHLLRTDPGVPVPRVVPTRDATPYGWTNDAAGTAYLVRAVGFQPGRPLEGMAAGRTLLRDIGRMLARLDRALAGLAAPPHAAPLVWDPRSAVSLRRFTGLIASAERRRMVELVIDRFAERLPSFSSLRHQTIHNDGHGGNLLIDGSARSVAGILDFGDMIHGPLAFELAVPAAEIDGDGLGPLDSAAELLTGYSAVLPLDAAEIAAFYQAILVRHALNITIQAWRTAHDPAGADKLDHTVAHAVAALDRLLSLDEAKSLALLVDAGQPIEARRRRRLGPGLELSYQRPVHFGRGDGAFLYDLEGSRYLDCYNNVPSVGHGNKIVADAIGRQMAEICSNTRYLHHTVLDYADRLTRTLPDGLETCLFVNSGSEANDAAWRIVKAVTGRSGMLVMSNAYHGITDAVAALSPYYGARIEPIAPHVKALEAPDLYRGRIRGDDPMAAASYAAAADAAIAALIQSGHGVGGFLFDTGFVSNGILDVPAAYVTAVVEKVRAAGGLIIADEVQAGFGRTGDALWGFQRYGIVPDLVTLGKPMANGHPVGAVVTRPDLLDRFTDRVEFFSTFGGNPVSAAAALATLDVIERDRLCAHALVTGKFFRNGIKALAQEHPAIGDVRGSGLLIGVDIVIDRHSRAPDPATARLLVNQLRDRHVLVGIDGPHGNVLKIRPPLPITQEQVGLALDALRSALESLQT